MTKLFKDININDTFKLNHGYNHFYKEDSIEVFRKTDKSHGICIEQTGFGNTRGLNKINTFYPNSIVII